MPLRKVPPKSDYIGFTEFIKKNFEKRECNRFRRNTIQKETEFCECGLSKYNHKVTAIQNETNQSEPVTKTFPTDAFGELELDENEYVLWNSRRKHLPKEHAILNCRQYVRLDYKTDVNMIFELFDFWRMTKPNVIFSVIPDDDCSADKDDELIEAKPNGSIHSIRKLICSDIVNAAASTNSWIITGGLNIGIDQLIGNEVKRRLANREKIPRTVLGICKWGRLSENTYLLNHPVGSRFVSNSTVSNQVSSGPNDNASESNLSAVSLNHHHTNFLLVDDGTQKNSGCECILRKMVEFTLTKRETNDNESDRSTPLIYILIGGSIDAFGLVARVLANGIPVIIATGTGGAADIISGALVSNDDFTLKHLPEVFENTFNRLEELLVAKSSSADEVRQIIAKIKTKTKLHLFVEIVELLDQTRISEESVQQFRFDIANVIGKKTNKLLAGIKALLISKHNTSDGSNHSAANAEFYTANRIRDVIEQMLVVNRIPKENAKHAIDDLEKDILDETLTKMKLVFSNLKAIRKNDQKDLLITFYKIEEQKVITNSVVDVLKKAKWTKPCDVYTLAADWNHEKFFRQLLQENWMANDHEQVFRRLLQRNDQTEYVQLMIEHVGDCNWLTKPRGPLEEEFRKTTLCTTYLLENIYDTQSNMNYKDERIKGKMLFIWCVLKQMPKTAMLFWKQGQDCLTMALIAYHESRKRMKLVDKEGYSQMKKQARFFSKLALDFVRKCYADNKKNTHDLLFGRVEEFDGITPFQIAAYGNFMEFLSVEPIENLLNKIWTKDILGYDKTSKISMFLSEVCPLLAPMLLDIRISADENNDEEQDGMEYERNYFSEIRSFVRTPLVNFFYWFISYVAYLTLFSIVMLTDFRAQISPSEIALTIWTFILMIEETKQAMQAGLRAYLRNIWNCFDYLGLELYFIGFIMRMVYHRDPSTCPDCLYQARITMAFSLMICVFRMLEFLLTDKDIGPKISMMGRLFSDLASFLLILAVFISSYGIGSNIILYPNQPLNAKLLKDVFYDAWWSVIQQFNREDALGLKCNEDNPSANITAEYCSNTTNDKIDYVSCKENRCPANMWIVSVLLAFYALLTVVMLLNVLIAMFNQTFTKVNNKHKEISTIQRYRLICEYGSHWKIPPPFCVITYPCSIFQFYRIMCKLYWCKDERHFLSDLFFREQSPDEAFVSPAKRLTSTVKEWEHDMAEEFYKKNKDKEGWPVSRKESETSDDFDETPLGRYIIQKIQNQITEMSRC